MSNIAPVVVPAVPPRPPQVTLLGSAARPTGDSDPATAFPGAEALALLPDEARAELEARKGDTWIRGITWQPEQHGSGWTYDPRGGYLSKIDYAQLTPPQGLTLQASSAAGTLPAATYTYQVTAIDANGNTTPCTAVNITTGSTGEVILTWIKVADNCTYGIYGRVSGSLGLIATVGPFDDDEPATYTDSSATSVGAAPPSSNTTAGSGTYSNLPIRTYVPIPIQTIDTCSSFGWSEHDYRGRAERWLDNAKYSVIEAEFWSGALAQAAGYPNDYLANASTNTDLTPGSVPSIARGFQILQDALAQTGFGGQGMIHVMPQTTPNLLTTRRVGALMLDQFDNIVVPGAGYTGVGPGGTAPGTGYSYMYATDLVMCRVEDEAQIYPDTFAEALDRGQGGFPNTITFRAQKFAAAYWDGAAHFSCKVQLAT